MRDFYDELPESGEKNPDKIPGGFKSLGVEIQIEDPPEPSDVLFENLEISENQRRRNKCLLYLFLFITVLIGLAIFTYLYMYASETSKKYPQPFNCKSVYSIFIKTKQSDLTDDFFEYKFNNKSKKLFKNYAEKDKKFVDEYKAGGFFQCYCDKFGSLS